MTKVEKASQRFNQGQEVQANLRGLGGAIFAIEIRDQPRMEMTRRPDYILTSAEPGDYLLFAQDVDGNGYYDRDFNDDGITDIGAERDPAARDGEKVNRKRPRSSPYSSYRCSTTTSGGLQNCNWPVRSAEIATKGKIGQLGRSKFTTTISPSHRLGLSPTIHSSTTPWGVWVSCG